MKAFIIGIDNVTREYYRVTANDEKQAYDFLADWAEGKLEDKSSVTYDGSGDSEYPVTSMGEAEEINDDQCPSKMGRHECCKPAGHVNDADDKMHVSENPAANWETEDQTS